VAVTLLGPAGCARPVGVDPAPSASEPVCAELLLALPDELGGQERRSTTSQASRAWGDPAIVLRCGVDPLPPTTEQCVGVTASDGTEVGWVVVEDDEQTRATSYGKTPAVEVTIPAEYAGDQTILTELTEAVAPLPQDGDRACL
jgi:hypothetical protein